LIEYTSEVEKESRQGGESCRKLEQRSSPIAESFLVLGVETVFFSIPQSKPEDQIRKIL